MKKFFFLLVFSFCIAVAGFAQTADSVAVPAADTLLNTDTLNVADTLQNQVLADSLSKRPVTTDTGWLFNPDVSLSNQTITQQVMAHHPYYGFSSGIAERPPQGIKKTFNGKEWLFYLLVLLLIIFGFLKLLFPKYFNDLFRLFFRTTLKQRQIREQLVQTPLPSLLLNGFFVISTGLYLSFILDYFHLNTIGNFWLLVLYTCAGLSLVYFIKFAGLKISGWLFSMEEVADSYIFIVFVVNKMLGILLLPFLVLIAFTTDKLYTAGIALSVCLVGGMLIYRFILTYAAVRNQVKVNLFHFFLYLCAFEIAPLLLIYKGLLLFFSITA